MDFLLHYWPVFSLGVWSIYLLMMLLDGIIITKLSAFVLVFLVVTSIIFPLGMLAILLATVSYIYDEYFR